MCTNFSDYCANLKKNFDDYLILFSFESDMKLNLSEDQITALSDLGFHTDFVNEVKLYDAWVVVIDGGKIQYEAVSNHDITYLFNTDSEKKRLTVLASSLELHQIVSLCLM